MGALLTLALMLGSNGAASADARLEGDWTVTLRDVRLGNLGDTTLRTTKRGWSFKPTCAFGPCDVVLTRRVRALGGNARQRLRRSGNRYVGTRSFPGGAYCRGRTVRRGYVYRVRVTLRVTGSTDDGASAERIRGRYVARGRPRSAVCHGGPRTYQESKVRGVRRQ